MYYVAGWTLYYCAPKASTIAADKRPLYFTFAASQTIDVIRTKRMNLPTSLVERRTWWSLFFCTCKYFDFICRVESIFLANLMLKMMLAYSNGDIVTKYSFTQ